LRQGIPFFRKKYYNFVSILKKAPYYNILTLGFASYEIKSELPIYMVNKASPY